jgi:hypothetical protein
MASRNFASPRLRPSLKAWDFGYGLNEEMPDGFGLNKESLVAASENNQ